MKKINLSKFVTLLLGISMFLACKKKDPDCDTCPCPKCPRIDNLLPNHGRGGDIIILEGANFAEDPVQNKVYFNTDYLVPEQDIIEGTTTMLKVVVPEDCGTGKVTIKITDEFYTNEGPIFTYDFARIDSIVPNNGKVGDLIMIYGHDFDPADTEVTINDTLVNIQSGTLTDSTLQFEVPDLECGSGKVIRITCFGNTTPAPQTFTYNCHTITSFSPSSAKADSIVTIIGSGFEPGSAIVTINGIAATNYPERTATKIKFAVPQSCGSANIEVSSFNKIAYSTQEFKYELSYSILTSWLSEQQAFMTDPMGLAIENNNIYVTDSSRHKIFKFNISNGVFISPIGTGQESPTAATSTIQNATFRHPVAICATPGGKLYVADRSVPGIIEINVPQNTVKLKYGSPSTTGTNDGPINCSSNNYQYPQGIIAIDGQKLLISEYSGNSSSPTDAKIRMLDPYEISASCKLQTLVTYPSSVIIRKFTIHPITADIYYADIYGSVGGDRIYKLSPPYVGVSPVHVAGCCGDGYLDGPLLQARFRNIYDMKFGPDGRLYIVDRDNFSIRCLDLEQGIVKTVAGNGSQYATISTMGFNLPQGICFDNANSPSQLPWYFYITDGGTIDRIRKVKIY